MFRYEIREANHDDGETVLLDNFVVIDTAKEAVVFEGPESDCHKFAQSLVN